MFVIEVGLRGAPQLGVFHPGAFVVELALVPEWEDTGLVPVGAVEPYCLAVSSRSSKASLQEGKGDESALNQHVFLLQAGYAQMQDLN